MTRATPPYIPALIRRRLRWVRLHGSGSPLDPCLQDAALALLVGAASCVALATVHGTGLFGGYVISCMCALAAAAGLMWRRSRPELCLIVSFAATLASDETTALVAAAYAVGRYGRDLSPVIGCVSLLYLSTRFLTGGLTVGPGWPVYVVVLDVFAPAACGYLVRRQWLDKRRMGERLDHARAATDQAARFAVLEKRTRLAFEIHDTVGHHATYLVMRAGAAGRGAGLPPEVAKDFEDIQETAIAVMRDLRAVIGVLRDPAERTEPPGVHLRCHEFLEGLTRNMRAIGMRAQYVVIGEVRGLGAVREGLLCRVVRESLTNVAKYAPGAEVRIALEYARGTVALAVRNNCPPHGGPDLPPAHGSGGWD
ncbi:sensor histidine kinase [Streptomyces lavendulae]|uniref:sensor histidine kinase n=1 Tax=Streptomyces lavendulae TaxID=1914 RepID=UPI0031E93086